MTIENPGLMVPLILLLLLVGVGVCVYVIVRFFRSMGKPKEVTPAKKQGGESVWKRLSGWLSEPTAPPRPARAEPVAVSAPAAPLVEKPRRASPDEERYEIFRVVRVGPAGKLVVEVEGRPYSTITQITDGAAGRRVLIAIHELEDFIGPHGARALPELDRLPPAAVVSPKPEEPLSLEQARFLAQLQTAAEPEDESEERMNVLQFWRQGLIPSQRKSVEPVDGDTNFIAEIDELLQIRLAVHPTLSRHTVRFRSAANGDLKIEVDNRVFGAVDDVDDPEVLALIRSTIQAWERR